MTLENTLNPLHHDDATIANFSHTPFPLINFDPMIIMRWHRYADDDPSALLAAPWGCTGKRHEGICRIRLPFKTQNPALGWNAGSHSSMSCPPSRDGGLRLNPCGRRVCWWKACEPDRM